MLLEPEKRRRPSLIPILAMIVAVASIGYVTHRPAPSPPAQTPAMETTPTASPSDWSVPKRFRGKLIDMRVRHFPRKIIALTFDDGPSSNITPSVLNALSAHKARATFFVLGRQVKLHPDLLRRMVAEGDAIGNHSYSHPKRVSPAKAVLEIDGQAKMVYRTIGRHPCCFRPPYGITKGNLALRAQKEGYAVLTWTISSADTRHIGPKIIAQNVLHTPNPGDIVLMHDSGDHRATANALPAMLDGLKKLGYECVTVPELLRAWDEWLSKPAKAK